MIEAISQFHFLRPLWLLALLPCLGLLWFFWKQQRTKGNWSRVIAPELLPWLLKGGSTKTTRWPLSLLLAGWVITCLAMAGPTWEKQPVPVSQNQNPLVVAVDLSYIMYTADLQPNRLTRTRFKLQDLFNERKDGLSAIVAYAGSAHTVAPLTDDSRTLNNLTRAMSPDIMPAQGNNPVQAIQSAMDLLAQGSNDKGTILLVTGSITQRQADGINGLLKGKGIRLSILGVGTEQGAPIPLPDGGYLKDRQRTIVVPQLETEALQALATANGGQYRTMTVDNADLSALLSAIDNPLLANSETISDREFDQWYDAGYWLVWLLLPLALFGFRRGWLMVLTVTLLPFSQDSMALEWQDLWKTQDQQAQEALQAGDAAQAAAQFDDPAWKAEALFQAEQYDQSAEVLNANPQTDHANNAYNQANALAKAGKLEDALKAYDNALLQQPDMEDAQFNRDLVEQMLKQQQEQQQQQSDNNPSKEQSQEQESQNPQSQGEQQSSQDNQNQQQPNSGQQSSENNSEEQPQSPTSDGDASENQQRNEESQQADNASEKEQETQQGEQQQAQNQPANEKPEATADQPSEQSSMDAVEEKPMTPEQQAIESWLRTIPDDPGGLLRRKFMQQHMQKQRTREEGSW
ncbi:VWA domain-containing protein [uncultured Endozoicomonas sp.]|uniref:vWA domain-containing protein n=1 Tax=uncultured Endozoicomonas sp. TaxID=432652 RepID=UPI002626D7D7|nr:VWA domain-containing protein [uncultured Endozoicomonas sp.]